MGRLGGIVGMGLILALGSSADALVLSSVDGTWSGVVGGQSINFPAGVVVPYGNHSENQVRWGIGTGFGQSGLGFTGAPPGETFNIGDPFELGQLRHFNEPIQAGTSANAVNLGVGLVFSDPAGLSDTLGFTFTVDETPNTPGPPLSDDHIYFASSYAPETFDIGGTLYTLQLLGFGNTPGSLVGQFNSPEGGTNATLLWGRITTPNPIPAPGAILLCGIGASVVGWLRGRRAL